MSTTGVAPAGPSIAVLGTTLTQSAAPIAFTGFPIVTALLIGVATIATGVVFVVFGRKVAALPVRDPGPPAWASYGAVT